MSGISAIGSSSYPSYLGRDRGEGLIKKVGCFMFNILAVVQRNQTRGMAREAWTRLDRVGLDNGDSISGRGILRFGNPRGFSFLVSAPK